MMSRIGCVLAVALAGTAVGLDDGVWGPADGVKALDSVEKALAKVVSNPSLTPAQLKRATHVAEDVKKDIEEVQTNTKLTKAERNAKVGSAIKELTDMQGDWEKLAHAGSKQELDAKLASLQKELAEKKKALLKDESMIKLFTLQKELAEKKLMLQKLMERKAAAGMGKKADEEEAKQETAMVGQLMTMAKGLATTKKADDTLPAPLKAILANLQSRTKKVSEGLKKLDADEKAGMAELEATLKKDSGDSKSKASSMLRQLKSQEHRKFAKARAMKKNELKELQEAEDSIEHHDVKRLKKTLAKMQTEAKSLAAKSGNFLH